MIDVKMFENPALAGFSAFAVLKRVERATGRPTERLG